MTLFDTTPFEVPPLPLRRFPLDPLLRIWRDDKEGLAAAMDVDLRTVQRWAAGGLSFVQADELACRAGRNAEELWDDWFAPDEGEA